MQKTSDNLFGELNRLEAVFPALSEGLTKAAEQFRQLGVRPAEDLVTALADYKRDFTVLANRIVDYGREVPLPSEQLAKLSASTLEDLNNSLRAIVEFEEQCRREASRKTAVAVLDRALGIVRRDRASFPPLLSCQASIRALRGEILSSPGPEIHPAVQEISDGKQAIPCLLSLIEDQGGLTDEESLNFYEVIARSFGKELAIVAARGKLEVQSPVASVSLPAQETLQAEALKTAAQEFPPELSPGAAAPLPSVSGSVSSSPQNQQDSLLRSPAASDRADLGETPGAIRTNEGGLDEETALAAEFSSKPVEVPDEYATPLPGAQPVRIAAAIAHAASIRASQPASFPRPRLTVISGRYELREELGKGGAGAVYKALDLQTGRTVAVKILYADGLSPDQLRLHKERMWREASIAGELRHPGIVTVLDIDDDETGHPYIVMDFVDGGTLEQTLTRRDGGSPPDLAQRLDIAIQLSKTLEYAHGRGVVHRDIKPSNILVGSDGHVKIADFGIALLAPNQASPASELPGTPAFIAPELLRDVPATATSDIFSLGVVLYWMFSGQMPFAGRTVTEITGQIANMDPLPVRQVNWALPLELEAILARCLAKNPAARYPGAALLAEDLAALRDSRPRLTGRGDRFSQKGEPGLRTQ